MSLITDGGQDIAPAIGPEQVDFAVRRMWNLDGPFPLPRFRVRCPHCGEGPVQLREVQMTNNARRGSPNPWRCNVSFKCCTCSLVFTFGVVVPEAMAPGPARGRLTWRRAVSIYNEWKRSTSTAASPTPQNSNP